MRRWRLLLLIALAALLALVGVATELLRRDRRFDRITLRHLLTMRSGLRYEESGTPWSDDTVT